MGGGKGFKAGGIMGKKIRSERSQVYGRAHTFIWIDHRLEDWWNGVCQIILELQGTSSGKHCRFERYQMSQQELLWTLSSISTTV